MEAGIGYDKCLSFINCQIKPVKPGKGKRTQVRAVTISRDAGSGAHAIAEQLATELQSKSKPGTRPWTVFDKDLVTKVLEDHNLPARMAEFIPEDRMTELQDAVQELFGLRPPSWTMIQHISETILRLIELGNVILIGRGANLVSRGNPEVLHVRLVGSETVRAARLAKARKITQKAALSALRKEDLGRARYVRKYFETDFEDSRLYHITFNTDLVSEAHVVTILSQVVLEGIGEPAR
jgi:cytidylate kinase